MSLHRAFGRRNELARYLQHVLRRQAGVLGQAGTTGWASIDGLNMLYFEFHLAILTWMARRESSFLRSCKDTDTVPMENARRVIFAPLVKICGF